VVVKFLSLSLFPFFVSGSTLWASCGFFRTWGSARRDAIAAVDMASDVIAITEAFGLQVIVVVGVGVGVVPRRRPPPPHHHHDEFFLNLRVGSPTSIILSSSPSLLQRCA